MRNLEPGANRVVNLTRIPPDGGLEERKVPQYLPGDAQRNAQRNATTPGGVFTVVSSVGSPSLFFWLMGGVSRWPVCNLMLAAVGL
jgi:hypothetical protein